MLDFIFISIYLQKTQDWFGNSFSLNACSTNYLWCDYESETLLWTSYVRLLEIICIKS